MNIIDIGSNSVRLFDGKKKTVITTRLAENMQDGMLDKISMARTVDAIRTLCEQADGKCYAFATEAVRKATNKADFVSEVLARTGITVDVLSGDEEAEISYMGATFGSDGSAAVIDLGGASCEVIYGDGGIKYKKSFPFGCVTMTDKFGSDLNGITSFVSATMDVPHYCAERYIAVGGTVTALAAMALGLKEYDPSKVDGYMLSCGKIEELIERVLRGEGFPTLAPARRKTIIQGATAFNAVLGKLGCDCVTISEKDNLEGYMLKLGINDVQ